MFEFLQNNLGVLLGLLLLMWIVQFGFTYVQMQRFYARLKVIRKDGITAVGMGGGQYRGRAYGVLTVDGDLNVIHAEKLAGWSNFSGLRTVPELIGMNLKDIRDEERELPVSKKLQEAFRNAAKDIQEADPETLTELISSKKATNSPSLQSGNGSQGGDA